MTDHDPAAVKAAEVTAAAQRAKKYFADNEEDEQYADSGQAARDEATLADAYLQCCGPAGEPPLAHATAAEVARLCEAQIGRCCGDGFCEGDACNLARRVLETMGET
jgi:hypothetical protein